MLFQVVPNLSSLLAQANPDCTPSQSIITAERFDELIEQSADNFSGVQTSWDEMWDFLFTASGAIGGLTSLYGILSIAGQILAVGTLLFFMLQWFKDINEGNISRPISELLWPLLAAFLFGFSSIPGIVFNNSINPLGSVITGLRQEYTTLEDNLYDTQGIVGPQSIRDSFGVANAVVNTQSICLLYTSPSPRDS